MNQVADENFEEIKCSQKSTNMKNKSKKAKDRSEAKDEISLTNEENLSDTITNTLHLNNLSSNLTNGTSEHSNGGSPNEVEVTGDAQDEARSERAAGVNSIKCSAEELSAQSKVDTLTHKGKQSTPSEKSQDVVVGENNREQVSEESKDTASEKSEEFNDNDKSKESTTQHAVNCIIDDALQSLQDSLNKREQSPEDDIKIISYESELQMPEIMRLIQKDLSEPYSIYTYRYFIHNWPKLCFLATHEGECIGAIVCKLDMHRNVVKRGYIAMLAVDKNYRNRKIGSRLARKAIKAMIDDNADEVVLETEITNKPALKLYENLGFVRDKRLFRYYLNGVDALRLKLWLR